MPFYYAPGVYIEEGPPGPRNIEPVGTSNVGFVGVAPKADARVNEAVRITNKTQFDKEFWAPDSVTTHLAQAVHGFFDNGGRVCYVVNVGKDGALVGDGDERRGLDLLKAIDDIAIVAAPGYTDAQSYDAVLGHCELMKDRFAILDSPEKVAKIDALTEVALARAPRKARPAEGEPPAGPPPTAGVGWRKSDHGAGYYPWITVRKLYDSTGELIDVPPSGHIAGIYARTDGERGVHKAPANQIVNGALNLAYPVTQEDQERLNPNGVNCIRFFSKQGILVWGARTNAKDPQWLYINVRRLFIFIAESIRRSTSWVVFEPNDHSLWARITRDIKAFLTLVHAQGALMGRTPEEAFFVKCDEETNPPEEIDAGRVNIVIGIAPVKPAEFVIFKIGQRVAGAEVTTQGGGNA